MSDWPAAKLIGAPELHHRHHGRDCNAGNYANISPLMDLLFGTYRCPDHEPESLGIREASPRRIWGTWSSRCCQDSTASRAEPLTYAPRSTTPKLRLAWSLSACDNRRGRLFLLATRR